MHSHKQPQMFPTLNVIRNHDLARYSLCLGRDGQTLGNVGADLTPYALRGMLMRGAASVVPADPMIDPYHTLLHELGIGVSRVIQVHVDNCSLTEAIERDTLAAQALRDHVAAGGMIEFFDLCGGELDVLSRMGISTDAAYNCSESLFHNLEKDHERKLAIEMGWEEMFPEFKIVTGEVDIRSAARAFFEAGYEMVFVKRPDLASGAGIFRGGSEDFGSTDFDEFLDDFARTGVPMVVDVGWGDVDCSIVFEIGDGAWRSKYFSGQVMEDDDPVAHAGNFGSLDNPIEGLPDDWSVEEREDIIADAKTRYAPILDWIAAQGVNCTVCFDLRACRETRTTLKIETNPRPSGSGAPFSVLSQLKELYGHEGLAVEMVNVHCPPGMDFEGICRVLGDDLATPASQGIGVIPANVLCLNDASKPKFAALCVTSGIHEARTLARRIKDRFLALKREAASDDAAAA